MIYLTFLSAFLLSGIAAYYSVIGLAAIFPGSFWPVVIMGSSLEFAKLITASWLYRNWKTVNTLLKVYLTTAVIVLMLITSMGIFGFLSKAHMEHSADVGPLVDKVALYNEKIKTEKENIDANRKILHQYDEIVDQTMGRTTDEKGSDKAQAIRRSQQKDRNRILQEIQQSQSTIAKYSEERAPLSNELKKAEADVGPIKYIAALVYGETVDGGVIDKAVRLVILLIILVFDPLAVLLLISGNISLADDKQEEVNEPKVEVQSVYVPPLPVEETEVADKDIVVEDSQRTEDVVKTKEDEAKVEIQRENIATIEDIPQHEDILEQKPERPVEYVLDPVFGNPIKKLEPKYDYSDPYTFREKENK